MTTLLTTGAHVLELVVILGIIWGITWLFPGLLPDEKLRDVVLVILAALVKFARANPYIPVKDYVNDQR